MNIKLVKTESENKKFKKRGKILSLQKNEPSRKGRIGYEKSVLHPARYQLNYYIVPAYFILSVFILILFAIFMSIDENRYFSLGLILLFAFVLLSIILLFYARTVVKKEIQSEVERYDLEWEKVPDQEFFSFFNGTKKIIFYKDKFLMDEEQYFYHETPIFITAEREIHRVMLKISFVMGEEKYFEIPLGAESIKMIRQYRIRPENSWMLERILADPKTAIQTIYTKGRLTV